MDLANASYLRDTDLKLIVNETDRVVKGDIIKLNFVIKLLIKTFNNKDTGLVDYIPILAI
jgi:hypothetical protein